MFPFLSDCMGTLKKIKSMQPHIVVCIQCFELHAVKLSLVKNSCGSLLLKSQVEGAKAMEEGTGLSASSLLPVCGLERPPTYLI